MTENETERFKRIAEKRTNKIIKTIQLLGNLSNTATYRYNDKDIEKIFLALNTEIKACRARFVEKTEKANNEFKLD
ncbi:MAG: hypothetical protein K0U45_01310 [Alphaproteobacteria bacterium]|nr:hypothetical protein [Alphaproteobacteria bacterium]